MSYPWTSRPPRMPPTDHALIEAFQNGDEFAFVALYNRYRGPVYAFCAKMLLDREAAQDVMQEAFVRVYENRQRLLSAGSFKAYLFAIARNQCLNGLRRARRHAPLPEAGPEAPAADTPFANLLKAEQTALVNRFLATLSPEYREVLVLREYQNLSYEEIAAVTRNTVSSVKSRLFKARRKLGQYLAPWLEPAEAPPSATPAGERRRTAAAARLPTPSPR